MLVLFAYLRRVWIIFLLHALLLNSYGFGWGHCQVISRYWHSFDEVISFTLSLSKFDKKTFLIILCAVCWSIWLMRNSIVFQHTPCIYNRNMLIKICSLIHYWSGIVPQKIKSKMKQWMLVSFEMIPLQGLPPLLHLPPP
jgi:hypothetical protein